MPDETFVVACVATFQRERELRRLLDGLNGCDARLGAVIVADNAATPGATSTDGRVVRIGSGNLGPGAAWKRGAREALARLGPRVTHFLFLDDDVVFEAGSLTRLLEGMESAGAVAVAVAPLLTDDRGHVWAFPEPVDRDLRRKIREVVTPEDAVRKLGAGPVDWCWCTGACVLVSRSAMDVVGFHRTDFWMLGEDLEFSMRLSAHGRCVFLPSVIVPHLPPTSSDVEAALRAGRAKFLALLQNLSYLAFHSPHSRHLWKYLPGNYRRFFRTEGWSLATTRDAIGCFWRGAICGQPRGAN